LISIRLEEPRDLAQIHDVNVRASPTGADHVEFLLDQLRFVKAG
jgi:hypothetical protein